MYQSIKQGGQISIMISFYSCFHTGPKRICPKGPEDETAVQTSQQIDPSCKEFQVRPSWSKRIPQGTQGKLLQGDEIFRGMMVSGDQNLVLLFQLATRPIKTTRSSKLDQAGLREYLKVL